LDSPILLESQMATIAQDTTLGSKTFPIVFQGGVKDAMQQALSKLCADVEAAVKAGCQCVVLSDRCAVSGG